METSQQIDPEVKLRQKRPKIPKKGQKWPKMAPRLDFQLGGPKWPIFARQRSDFRKNRVFGHFGRRDSPAYEWPKKPKKAVSLLLPGNPQKTPFFSVFWPKKGGYPPKKGGRTRFGPFSGPESKKGPNFGLKMANLSGNGAIFPPIAPIPGLKFRQVFPCHAGTTEGSFWPKKRLFPGYSRANNTFLY